MQKFSITPPAVPIPVVRGAYRVFCTRDPEADQQTSDETDIETVLTRFDERPVLFEWSQADFEITPDIVNQFKFKRLVSEWRRERDATSSFVSDMAMCTSYQKIIGMGDAAIPLILSELRSEGDEPDHWFWALRVITDVDPVPVEDRGQTVKMARAWLAWGEQQGYAG